MHIEAEHDDVHAERHFIRDLTPDRELPITDNGSHHPRHLRVFLASPGDVVEERGLAL